MTATRILSTIMLQGVLYVEKGEFYAFFCYKPRYFTRLSNQNRELYQSTIS